MNVGGSIIDILLVDDSLICLQQLRAHIEADGDLRVVGQLRSGQGVLEAIARLRPKVLVTDLVMPDANGLEVVSEVMAHQPLPIVVVSGGGVSASSAYEAIRRGALEVATKPPLGERATAAHLREALRRVANVPVLRHPGHSPRATTEPTTPATRPLQRRHSLDAKVIAVGASAGGPGALIEFLAELAPENAPPILIAQHLPDGHAAGFADFLAQRCRFEVIVCSGPTPLVAGRVVVPTDRRHLIAIDRHRVGIAHPDSGTLCMPSVDVLLASVALNIGSEAVGIVLTGIGSDGAMGLAAMKAKRAFTMVQDKQSSPVYGMPQAASAHADLQLSPREMACVLNETLSRPTSRVGR